LLSGYRHDGANCAPNETTDHSIASNGEVFYKAQAAVIAGTERLSTGTHSNDHSGGQADQR
jgi:hypothetical protein